MDMRKWIIGVVILVGCQLEPEIIYIPEIHEITDTLFVHDTSYVTKTAVFGLTNEANLYFVNSDTLGLIYWYALTKLDSTLIDSVFLTGFLFEWNSLRTSATMIDSTRIVAWSDNAQGWNNPFDYGNGEFYASNKWAISDWSDGFISYTMALEYK